MNTTISYTAAPADSRCAWWSKHIPAGFAADIDLADKESLASLPFLKKNADLELEEGEAILDSEANHHRKARGYTVQLLIARGGKLRTVKATGELKIAIKQVATPEQWAVLKQGSGDVAAVLRYLKAITIMSPEQVSELRGILFPKKEAATA